MYMYICNYLMPIAQAEEMIKQEMLVMLRNDLINHPAAGSNIKKSELAILKAELNKKPLEPFTIEELSNVSFIYM